MLNQTFFCVKQDKKSNVTLDVFMTTNNRLTGAHKRDRANNSIIEYQKYRDSSIKNADMKSLYVLVHELYRVQAGKLPLKLYIYHCRFH